MLFEWDVRKAQSNARKHGVSFELATTMFSDPLHLSIPDPASTNEERWVTIGRAGDHSSLVVVHTYRDQEADEEVIRIISARKATKKEQKQYEEGI